MEEFTPDAPATSKYHTAFFKNSRLHNLWLEAQNHARQGNYAKWNADLDMIWSDLAGDVDPEDPEQGIYNQFLKDLADTGSLTPPAIRGFESYEENYIQRRAQQYAILLNKHVWLKRLENKQGRGTAYKDDDDDEF